MPERPTKHRLGDHQVAIGGDDQALGAERSVRDAWRHVVKSRHGVEQLAQQEQHGVGMKRHAARPRGLQHLRQSPAVDGVRHDHEPSVGCREPADLTDSGAVWMKEPGKLLRPPPDGRFEQ
jgi:hypothetical protein